MCHGSSGRSAIRCSRRAAQKGQVLARVPGNARRKSAPGDAVEIVTQGAKSVALDIWESGISCEEKLGLMGAGGGLAEARSAGGRQWRGPRARRGGGRASRRDRGPGRTGGDSQRGTLRARRLEVPLGLRARIPPQPRPGAGMGAAGGWNRGGLPCVQKSDIIMRCRCFGSS